MTLRQKMKSRRNPGIGGLNGKNGKLVRCYVYPYGISGSAAGSLQEKERNYVSNRVLLFIILLLALIPGIYCSFF